VRDLHQFRMGAQFLRDSPMKNEAALIDTLVPSSATPMQQW
jgi:hypothetical protein